jgi:hypothetical protein
MMTPSMEVVVSRKSAEKQKGKVGAYLSIVALVAIFFSLMQIKMANINHAIHTEQHLELGKRSLLTFKNQNRTLNRKIFSAKNVTRIAYAITIPFCPPEEHNGLIQAAAILSYNIKVNSFVKHPGAKYNSKLFAFVHPDAKQCGMILASFGWKVLWKEAPFQLYDLNGNTRDAIKTAVRVNDYMKLYTYTLTDYPLVVYLDVDSVLTQPLDDVLDVMLGHASPLDMISSKTALPNEIDFAFTRDYTLNISSTLDPNKRSLGPNFVVRPSQAVFDDMLRGVKNTDFTTDKGWDNKFYGVGDENGAGVLVSGFLSYFYGEVRRDTSVELHPCIYNTNGQDVLHQSDGTCRREIDCRDCSKTTMSDIKLVHFDHYCEKPWKCPLYIGKAATDKPKCLDLHQAWHAVRLKFDLAWNHVIPGKGGWGRNITLGYCRGSGRRSYMRVPIPRAFLTPKSG